MDVIQIIHFRKSESIKNAATQLEATRWRLRFLVGLAQWLRVTLKDCQILRPGRTVAATGKRSTRFGRRHDGPYLKKSDCCIASELCRPVEKSEAEQIG